MTELQFRSPIEFPEGWVRTPPNAATINQQFAQNMNIEEALRYLQDEITSLGAHKAIFHSNYDSIQNNRNRSKRGHSEGASIQVSLGSTDGFIACDKWYNITQNIYALHLAIRHFRMFEDWGIATGEFLIGRFTEADKTRTVSHNRRATDRSSEWMDVLSLGKTATLEDANVMYRFKAKQVAEDEDGLIALNQAIEEARKALR